MIYGYTYAMCLLRDKGKMENTIEYVENTETENVSSCDTELVQVVNPKYI